MGIEIIGQNPRFRFDFSKAMNGERMDVDGKLSNEVTGKRIFVKDAIQTVKKAGDIFNKRLDFRVDEDTNRIMVKVIDTTTDKVIKEIPPEQLVELAAKIQEMVGLLVDEER